MENSVKPDAALTALRDLIRALRAENGCPWDRKQTPASIARYMLEEIYELKDAIAADDADAVREELGDVLFHVFFIAHLYDEKNQFNIEDAAQHNHTKMVRRHPHVFGSRNGINSDRDVRAQWQRIKQDEKEPNGQQSILDSIPIALPALMRAYRVSERAAGCGFDWDSLKAVMAKVEEEWAEFKTEIDRRSTAGRGAALEFGDLLFCLVNVARFAGFHPDNALSDATAKFERRFRQLEQRVIDSGRHFSEISVSEMNRIWDAIKADENT